MTKGAPTVADFIGIQSEVRRARPGSASSLPFSAVSVRLTEGVRSVEAIVMLFGDGES
jgi:hypothetical protein